MENIMNDLVSIITPNYNSQDFVTKTINSVLKQTYPNWEMIIVDDNSNDNSINIIEDFINTDSRIKLLINRENLGPATTRNKAIKEAKGRYIAFLDSDDLWNRNFLEKMINFISQKNATLVFASYKRFLVKDHRYIKDFIVPSKVTYYDILKTNPISCLTAFYDTKKLGKLYMPDILKRQDYGLWLKILKKVEFAYGFKESVATYNMREDSHSRNKFKAAQYQWKIYTEVEKLGFIKSLYYFIHYAINGFLKYKG